MMLPLDSIALLCLGILLLLHHGWKHASDDPSTSHAQKESCALVCYFQHKDIAHFETWILVCLTNALTIESYSPFYAQTLIAVGLFLGLTLVVTRIVLCVSAERSMLHDAFAEEEGSSETSALCAQRGRVVPHVSIVDEFSLMLHNVSNHETWILVCFTNATSLAQEA